MVLRSEYRWSLIKVQEVDLRMMKKVDLGNLVENMEKIVVQEDPDFKCDLCG